MKMQTIIVALAAALFIAPVFADHNRTDEQGRKQGHWTEFPKGKDLLGAERLFYYGDEKDRDLLVAEGKYVDGKRRGQWVLRYADDTVEEGPVLGNKRHGHWVVRFVDGSVWEGHVVAGKRHGHWVMRFADGYVFEGSYVAGKWHGQWVMRKPDGTVTRENYRNGKRVE